jgi:hypothetical protein
MSASFRAIASASASGATSLTLTRPSGHVVGDLLLAVLLFTGGSGITVTAPAGWVQVLRQNDGTTAGLLVLRQRNISSVADSHTITFSGSVTVVGCLAAYGGVEQAVPVDASASQANAASTTATVPSVTTSKAHLLRVALFGAESGSPTVAEATGMLERAEVSLGGLTLSVQDEAQATAGASGTEAATLSASAASLCAQVALAASALNTSAAVQDEGNWRQNAWSANLPTQAEFDAFVEGLIQRANQVLRRRVGMEFYTENILLDPWNGLLKEAEMHLVQARLLEIAAGIAESGDDTNPAPFLGTGASLRTQVARRLRAADEIIAMTRDASRPGPHAPYFQAATGASAIRTRFESEG